MSKLWLNIRFGIYHLQCGEPHWWSIRIPSNKYHVNNPKRFEIYQFFRWQK
jgi:hypothetical protein